MSVSESTINNPKKQLEFYKDLSEYLQQENQKQKEQLDYLRSGEYLNQLKFERDMLQNIVDNGEVSEEDKTFIDMTHRNTELLEQLQQREIIIECLYHGVAMNEEQEELLDRILFSDKYKGDN